jgi:hypothetical protein
VSRLCHDPALDFCPQEHRHRRRVHSRCALRNSQPVGLRGTLK